MYLGSCRCHQRFYFSIFIILFFKSERHSGEAVISTRSSIAVRPDDSNIDLRCLGRGVGKRAD